jgi:hypothetical protein
MMSLSTYFKQMDKELVEKLTPHLRHKTMNNRIFVVGDQYSCEGGGNPLTYLGESTFHNVGLFERDSGSVYHYEYASMTPYTKAEPKYPNPPLPHCEERIAFARGANIEQFSLDCDVWHISRNPSWDPEILYRVKVEKTKDELRIEELERLILEHDHFYYKFTKELAELKPTVHY